MWAVSPGHPAVLVKLSKATPGGTTPDDRLKSRVLYQVSHRPAYYKSNY